MEKLVILGNSPAGVKVIEEMRVRKYTGEIALLGFEGFYPYRRELFPDFLAKEIPEDQLFCQPPEFYSQNQVEVLLEHTVEKINFKKRRLVTNQEAEISYDFLLITDSQERRFSQIKGATKQGVYTAATLTEIKGMLKTLALVDTVVVETTTPTGLRLAHALKTHDKEVILIVPTAYLLSDWVDESMAANIQKHLESQGVRVICDNAIVELLGDSQVKALRLKSGKVLASQMVVFPEARPDLKAFAESGLELWKQEAILVDLGLRTSVDRVYATDCVVCLKDDTRLSRFSCLQELEEQGVVVARQILGEDAQFVSSLPPLTINLSSVPISLEKFSLSK